MKVPDCGQPLNGRPTMLLPMLSAGERLASGEVSNWSDLATEESPPNNSAVVIVTAIYRYVRMREFGV